MQLAATLFLLDKTLTGSYFGYNSFSLFQLAPPREPISVSGAILSHKVPEGP
ncbi:hypothetical protein PghCCS26_36900 [Paenibacillus glycanilyticus]|uniref:Uncharacterized protein n=1 Tax=Paenibacillus glycanilyticus TaxID=126569 RepID=A0ABQ6NN90_9BACL|nr:hypothetical protein PghCCS26_36900 [Paenibacillus glycanilyticus]